MSLHPHSHLVPMTNTVPKAVLYSHPKSVESATVFLTLEEKGYGSDEVDIKTVNITKGENFAPSYLRINIAGSVPTLVVPTNKTLAPEIENKYRAITDVKAIVEFLDKSRSTNSRTHTTSTAPAPTLAPATIADANVASQIIAVLHAPAFDPLFLLLAARDAEELSAKANGPLGVRLRAVRDAIAGYLAEPAAGADEADAPKPLHHRIKKVLEEKQADNAALLSVYQSSESDTTLRQPFFARSVTTWDSDLKKIFDALEKLIAGPYTLGDQLSIPDLHLISWIAHVVHVAGGEGNMAGLASVEKEVTGGKGGWEIGTKVRAFWEAAIERKSFQKVYANGLH